MISCSSSKQMIVNLTIDHIILGLVYQYIVIHVIKHLPSVTIKFLRLIYVIYWPDIQQIRG